MPGVPSHFAMVLSTETNPASTGALETLTARKPSGVTRVTFDASHRASLRPRPLSRGTKRLLSGSAKPTIQRQRANSDSALPAMGPFASPNRTLGAKAAVRRSTLSASRKPTEGASTNLARTPSQGVSNVTKLPTPNVQQQPQSIFTPTMSVQASPILRPNQVSPLQLQQTDPNGSPPPYSGQKTVPQTPRLSKNYTKPMTQSVASSYSTGRRFPQISSTSILVGLLIAVPVIILTVFCLVRFLYRYRQRKWLQRRRTGPVLYAAPRYEPEMSPPPPYEVATIMENKYTTTSKIPAIARADSDNI